MLCFKGSTFRHYGDYHIIADPARDWKEMMCRSSSSNAYHPWHSRRIRCYGQWTVVSGLLQPLWKCAGRLFWGRRSKYEKPLQNVPVVTWTRSQQNTLINSSSDLLFIIFFYGCGWWLAMSLLVSFIKSPRQEFSRGSFLLWYWRSVSLHYSRHKTCMVMWSMWSKVAATERFLSIQEL